MLEATDLCHPLMSLLLAAALRSFPFILKGGAAPPQSCLCYSL